MVSIFYPPYSFGGDGIYLYRLCTELVRRGHEVDVIHCSDSYHFFMKEADARAFPVSEGITLHRLETGAGMLSPLLAHQTGFPVLTGKKIKSILQSKQFDVIHYHNVSLFGPGVFAIDPGYDAVKFYTTHDHWLVCPMNVLWKNNERVCDGPNCVPCAIRSKRPPQWWRYSNLMRDAASHIDLVLTPSLFCRDMCRSRGFEGQMSVMPYFVNPPEPAPFGEAPPHDRPFFLYVGRLEKIKGLQHVFPLFAGPGEYDLVVVGSGVYEPQLRQQAAGIERIRFVGWKTAQEMAIYQRHALALIVASVTYETFGIVVIEAYAHGLPVIVNNLGPLPEIVLESDGGLIYDSPEQLQQHMDHLFHEPEDRVRLGRQGFEAYQRKWTPDAHINTYETYIRQTREKKPGIEPGQEDSREPELTPARAQDQSVTPRME